MAAGSISCARRLLRRNAGRVRAWAESSRRNGNRGSATTSGGPHTGRSLAGELPKGWDTTLPICRRNPLPRDRPRRRHSQHSPRYSRFAGGSATWAGNGTNIKFGDVSDRRRLDQLYAWGVREHAMFAAMNGMAAHGGMRPVRRHLSRVLRLLQAFHPACLPDAPPGGVRLHP